VLFYLKRPRLRPLVFGYHEVWHVMTVVAAVLQFAALGVLVARVA
jgi:hemolysin III